MELERILTFYCLFRLIKKIQNVFKTGDLIQKFYFFSNVHISKETGCLCKKYKNLS